MPTAVRNGDKESFTRNGFSYSYLPYVNTECRKMVQSWVVDGVEGEWKPCRRRVGVVDVVGVAGEWFVVSQASCRWGGRGRGGGSGLSCRRQVGWGDVFSRFFVEGGVDLVVSGGIKQDGIGQNENDSVPVIYQSPSAAPGVSFILAAIGSLYSASWEAGWLGDGHTVPG